jgi:hypothetical protein
LLGFTTGGDRLVEVGLGAAQFVQAGIEDTASCGKNATKKSVPLGFVAADKNPA